MGFLKRVKKIEEPSNIRKLPFYKRKGGRIFLICLGSFLVIIAALVSYLYATSSKIFENGLSLVGKNGILSALSGHEAKLEGEDSGRINILLAGMGGSSHPGGQLTDSMMVLSIDTANNKVAFLSIPRDLNVPIHNRKVTTKINEAYSIGETAKKGDGPKLMSDTVSDVIGTPINYYITADFAGFEKVVDALGGIDIYVDKAIVDYEYPDDAMNGYQTFKISAGQHHLDGKTALKYARSRHSTSDFDRAERQQKIIAAVKDKAAELGFLSNPKKILDLISILSDHTRTNLQPAEIRRLAEIAGKVDKSSVLNEVLTDGSGGLLVSQTIDGRYCLVPKAGASDFSEIKKLFNNIFLTSVEKSTARVEILNGSDTAGVATTFAKQIQNDSVFDIISVTNTTTKLQKTVIYDHTNGAKKVALANLQTLLNVTPTKQDSTGGADITVVLGNDYKSTKTSQ